MLRGSQSQSFELIRVTSVLLVTMLILLLVWLIFLTLVEFLDILHNWVVSGREPICKEINKENGTQLTIGAFSVKSVNWSCIKILLQDQLQDPVVEPNWQLILHKDFIQGFPTSKGSKLTCIQILKTLAYLIPCAIWAIQIVWFLSTNLWTTLKGRTFPLSLSSEWKIFQLNNTF